VQPVDASTPNVARAYDYLLGGRDHFAADRALAARILEAYPLTAELMGESRAFLAGAVGHVARRGVTQYIDVGAGLPTRPNVHETAREVVPGARVVYIDNDPAVLAHASGLLRAGDGVRVMAGDLSEPEALLTSPELASVVDLGQPACLILTMVLHLLDAGTARAVAGVLTRHLAPGSYAIVSGTVGRGMHGGDHSPEEIASFFGGLDLVEPGLVDARAWPSSASSASSAPGGPGLPERVGYVLCGVGYKPAR
jgi:S-adenosyl methyltransferase